MKNQITKQNESKIHHIFWLIIPILMLLINLSCAVQQKSNEAMQVSNPANSDEKPIFIQAGDLIKEYKENPKAADAKYKGKSLTVTGQIGIIIKTPDFLWNSIHAENFDPADKSVPRGVGYNFSESERAKLDELTTFQKITVIGKNEGVRKVDTGLEDGGSNEYIALQDCRIGKEKSK